MVEVKVFNVFVSCIFSFLVYGLDVEDGWICKLDLFFIEGVKLFVVGVKVV